MRRVLVGLLGLVGLLELAALATPAGQGRERAAAQPAAQKPAPSQKAPAAQPANDAKLDLDAVRDALLTVINAQRAQVGAPPVALDALASEVAAAHALDMAQHNYLSHWNRDGWLPYLRYGLRGGTDYSAENVSMLSGLSPRATLAEVRAAALRLHQLMHDETPPNDGHRRTILNPEHTHVGLGLAVVGKELRLAQEFLSRYVRLDPLPAKARPTDRLTVVGRMLDPAEFQFYGALARHEPLPQPMTVDQLRQPRAYALPEKSRLLKPRLADGAQYDDGTTGDIEIGPGGRFTLELDFPKRAPGIYTTVIFIQRGLTGNPFPAASLSVWVE
ncbi:MAG: hypothetical protein CFK52_11595 [Chloracidobacterium sp. CP2_5A]|nr:MAG: hypothetical protein CFK52_11595 [Chloracidobacterium sp. CP2_5A]